MDIISYTKEGLENLIVELGDKKYRAGQIYEWIHKKHVTSYDEMLNVPKALKEKLAEIAPMNAPEIVTFQESKIDGTRKYLYRLYDDSVIESVFMRYKHGNSVCISSQVGCRMGCRFCASTLDGLMRNLSAGEMLMQIYGIERDTGERVSNVVVMGTGEPLDNYDNLIKFIKMLSDENGINISQRNITLSTCGLVPKIDELAGEDLQITLALSLHASNQKKREALMPIALKYNINDVVDACQHQQEYLHRKDAHEQFGQESPVCAERWSAHRRPFIQS